MSRKGIKILTIALMLILSILTVANSALAVSLDLNVETGLNGTADSAITNPAQKVIATAINTIQIVGMGIAIIMLVMIAIKYMTAAPSDKADFKKSATAYIVGAVVLFAASGILGIVKNFATTSIKAE